MVINIGIIGAGLQGRRRAQAVEQFPDGRLLAVSDVDDSAARALAASYGAEVCDRWEDLAARKDLDVVVICTPPSLHATMSIVAMKNGKHVLCEKPLALNPAEGEEMVVVAKARGVLLKCGFNHRHHPAIKQAHAWTSQRVIGPLMYIRCVYGIGGRPGYEKDWRAKADVSGGGQLMDQGMHLLDLCRYFMGEYDEAYGSLSTDYWDIAPLEDNAFITLRTQQGQIAQLHTSWTQWKNLFSFEVFGKDGYICANGLGGSYGTERAILGKRAFLEPFHEEIIEYRGADHSWQEEWQEFAAAITEQREPMANGEDGLMALKLAAAIYQSAAQGRIVKLRP